MKKMFRLPNRYRNNLQNRTLKLGSWIFGVEPIKLKSEDLKILKVSEGRILDTYEVKKKIQFRDLKLLIDDIAKSNVSSFKGTNKSKIVKIYIDHEVYYTRTKGRLRVKNKKFKTNLEWLAKELSNRGLTNTTPDNYN